MSSVVFKDLSPDLRTFDYHLPEELIAQFPLPDRTSSRLLCLEGDGGQLRDLQFPDIIDLVGAGDVLVFNNTRVVPARLQGRKATGGRVELLVERILDENKVLSLAGSNKPLRVGSALRLEKGDDAADAVVTERRGEFFLIEFARDGAQDVLDRLGHMPLPPYIRRPNLDQDRERYQTVYASLPGAVAAPTAGLHFDERLMESLRKRGVQCVFLTLHVGAGTFQPIRVSNPLDHRMHPEWVSIPGSVGQAVSAAKARGNKVVAVGTTSVRALETLALRANAVSFEGYTDLFLYPGKRFKLVDAMITNFHLPRSSLLMLVCAFAGTENILNAYRHAVASGYRFYSYGDAMFVTLRKEEGDC